MPKTFITSALSDKNKKNSEQQKNFRLNILLIELCFKTLTKLIALMIFYKNDRQKKRKQNSKMDKSDEFSLSDEYFIRYF